MTHPNSRENCCNCDYDAKAGHFRDCPQYPHNPNTEDKCATSPLCSHNTNGRDLSKPCSVEFRDGPAPAPHTPIETTKALINDEIVTQAIPTLYDRMKEANESADLALRTETFGPQPPIPTGWEERFDELPIAVAYIERDGTKIIDFDYLKDQMEKIVKPFIRNLLSAQRTSIAAKVERMIEQEKAAKPTSKSEEMYEFGFVTAARAALSAIREEV